MIPSGDIYEPAEDSYLLQRWVRRLAFGRVLDLGTGSGIQAITAAENPSVREVVAVDLNPAAIAQLQAKRIRKLKVVQSDLFADVDGLFNVIIFNPPYLPQDRGIDDIALYGGKKGWEISERFFREASRFLHPDGKILFLFSTLTNKAKIEELIHHHLFSFEEIAREKIAFEELFVYEIKKTPLLRQLEAQGFESVQYFTEGRRGIIYQARYNRNLRIKSFIPSRTNYLEVVIKVQKEESKAENIVQREAFWLQRANDLGIGPRLFMAAENFVALELIRGEPLPKWLEAQRWETTRTVLKQILEHCFLLDQHHLSKEEMHHPLKHILITPQGKPVLLDFERCHETEKPQNVTQFVEYICRLKSVLEKQGAQIDLEKIRAVAKRYKENYGRKAFEEILNLIL